MRILPSVCTNLWFPESRKDIGVFREVADFLSGKGIGMIEFYHDGPGQDQCGSILRERGLQGMYVGVLPHKEQLMHLCNPDESARVDSVKLATSCMDQAASQGVENIMYNSGRLEAGLLSEGMEAFHRSFAELFNHAQKKHYAISISMEPCDSRMDSCQMIGPSDLALEAAERLNREGMPLLLVMDSAHYAEEGEDFIKAVRKVKAYCKHIHYANCNLTLDKSNPLYGDKHIGFEYPDSMWTPDTLKALTTELDSLYEDQEIRVALEVLCRDKDPFVYFDRAWESLLFLHA